ncbi:MAG TPA: cupredoxin domain-containing protein [Candidatus Nanoarchaeia archaeon]|nr:cupredoxin domain-containing protein [Candidatus Nanoarchaeia archaeon]
MKKIILFLIFGLLLISACSKQNPESLVGQGSDVVQQGQQTAQQEQQPVPQETTSPAAETPSTEETTVQAEVKEFKITAKQFSFDPATIEVNKGDKVRLIVTSVDVPHGIAIKEYGINQRLDVGKPATIEFTADKNGEFTTYCSVVCGAGHGTMKGKLIVH